MCVCVCVCVCMYIAELEILSRYVVQLPKNGGTKCSHEMSLSDLVIDVKQRGYM
jgi:hypothetical protein